MKTTLFKTKRISILLTVLILLQSCVAYKSHPITLKQASLNEEKVKVVTKSGENLKFYRITEVNDSFYGFKKLKGKVVKTPLDPKWIEEIKEKDKNLSTLSTILLPVTIITAGFLLFVAAYSAGI